MGNFFKRIINCFTNFVVSFKQNKIVENENKKVVSYTLSSIFPSVEIQEQVYEFLRKENEKQVSN